MSRSRWACAESCAPVNAAVRGAGRLATPEARVPHGDERLPGTARSLTHRCWLAATALLVLALTPAVAVAGVGGSPDSRKSDPPRAHSAPARDAIAGGRWLAFGSGYVDAHGSQLVAALQRLLAWAGYAPGPIDGRYGPLTEQAVIRFQSASGLPVDGIAGPRTRAALAATPPLLYPGSGSLQGGSALVRTLQNRLVRAGYPPGPVDGRYGPLTEHAVLRFQAANGLQVDGIAGPQTFVRLAAYEGSTPHRATLPSDRFPRRPSDRGSRSGPASAQRNAQRVRRAVGSSSDGWLLPIVVSVVLLLGAASWLVMGRRGRGVAQFDPPPRASLGVTGEAVTGETVTGETVAHETVADETVTDETVTDETVTAERPADETAAGETAADETGTGEAMTGEAEPRTADRSSSPVGPFVLGLLLEARGDLVEAAAAYERADQRCHAAAACRLGALLERQGELDGAEHAYRRADHRGDADGAFHLGLLLERRGDLAGAVAAFRRAAERGSPRVAEMAQAVLHELGRGTDAPNGAERRGHDAR